MCLAGPAPLSAARVLPVARDSGVASAGIAPSGPFGGEIISVVSFLSVLLVPLRTKGGFDDGLHIGKRRVFLAFVGVAEDPGGRRERLRGW